MKVLLVWSEIPESVKLYALEDDDAVVAVKCHNLYINNDDSEDLEKLSEILEKETPLDSSNPVDIEQFDKVVLSGFYL